MQYLYRNQIREIHVEPTSRCNLACPQCARTFKGKGQAELPLQDIDHEIYAKLFSRELCARLDHVYFCGNYGDPVAAINLLDEISFLRAQGVPRISVFSNGSLRTPEWWQELGKLLSAPEDKVAFSIDGLESTNHLYRVNANWEKIMANCQAFIRAGGRARWDWLVFAHNEAQVEEARELSRRLGFVQFNVKSTARFASDQSYKSGKPESAAKTRAGDIEPGENKNVKQFSSVVARFGSWTNYINQTRIKCKYQGIGALYLDFEGDLWPCCWTGAAKYFISPNTQRDQLEKLYARYGRGFNSLYKLSLDEVLAHPWFSGELAASWQANMDAAVPKLLACGRTCGADYEFTGMIGTSNSSIEDLTSEANLIR
ncbi:MAG: radical SAM protein [Bdellovibrionales bacterium]|nr:radical SAM protein [Bdellovibrionales bacterium]